MNANDQFTQQMPTDPFLLKWFDDIPHGLRTSMASDDPAIISYVTFNGCGVQIRSVPSPRVPWLLTVFLTTVDDLYFEHSLSITREQAQSTAVAKAKVEGATRALWWMMSVHGHATSMQPHVRNVIDYLRQLLVDANFSDQLEESPMSADAQHTQLSLF